MADKVTVPVPQRVALTGAVATADAALTVAVTLKRVAEIQPPVVFLASAK